jgi:peptide-methionine (R)-S-oxide reductase
MNDRRALLGLMGSAAVGLLLFGRSSSAAPNLHFAVNRSAEDWRRRLGPKRYAVLREAATERPFSSPLLNEHRKGVFVCAGCANPLFSSATKFESGTGWPSFWKPLPHAVVTRPDRSLVFERTEVLCARCGGHLGHVFDDGPRDKGGQRFCINSCALDFDAGAGS